MTFHYQSPDSYSYHTNDPALVALIMGCYFLIIFLSLAAAALVYVSRWHIFKKMGMPGWKGIIPYYGDYMLFKTVWTTKAFWAMIIGAQPAMRAVPRRSCLWLSGESFRLF